MSNQLYGVQYFYCVQYIYGVQWFIVINICIKFVIKGIYHAQNNKSTSN
jgi:hypothetical protein